MSLREEMELMCSCARVAAQSMALASTDKKNRALLKIAELIEKEGDILIEANKLDLAAAEENGVPGAMMDRLTITKTRLAGMCASLRDLVKLEDPVGKSESWSRPSGIEITESEPSYFINIPSSILNPSSI